MSVIEDSFIYPRTAEGGPAQRVERTDLWRFPELERTIAALTERVAQLEQERDTLKHEVQLLWEAQGVTV